ncbi:MAG: tRNA pseudouridine(38-40) synthase TruA [Nannocystaceae bacterium]
MTTYRLTIAYDGRAFKGWQRHPGQPTVQGALEAALLETTGVRAAVEGAGRTDAGAHADAQVASVTVPDEVVLGDLDDALPAGIRVLDTSIAADGFHARVSARGKTYRYEIWNAAECPEDRVGRVWHIPRPLDVEAMRAACPYFVGELDFATFAKKPNFDRATTVRHMRRVELRHEAPMITITMCADSFLYKMVRNVVRTIVKAGEGRVDPAAIPALISARDRKAAPGTAPASGLYLETVHY